ncbi:MAG: sulfotransferase family protein [Planctomycetota bacterium]|nr:MAG: sulfotransferase family protein [Planctomycetota bacterium]REJ97375.1 MAG: sulfotransferase family protein [Planctomycetota bacterium]REK27714.1 MAG: sulfotransferase family protein [Planctomycetota bacterium]REK38444.1 MAG: sulfotransferase family protein [Planctomycetota bacterium]
MAPPAPFVTIVTGLPRSGTSMMMKMLAAGGMDVLTDRVRRADDDNPGGYYEFEPVKKTKDDASWLQDAAGKAVKMIYMLLADLPSAYTYRVLFMQRDYDEVLASQQVMLERRGEKGAGLSSERMAEIFDRQLVETRDWLAKQPNFEVLYLDYHRIVEDPLSQAEQVCGFLGMPLDARAMAGIVDPDLYRQRAT